MKLVNHMAFASAVLLSMASVAAVAEQSQSQSGQGATQQDQGQSSGVTMKVNPQTVRETQKKLNSMGYDAGPVDGQMGQKTESALKNFQESQGMPATGNIDHQTLGALGVIGGGQGQQQGQGSQGLQQQGSGQDQQSQGMPGQDSQQQQQGGGGMNQQPSDQGSTGTQ